MTLGADLPALMQKCDAFSLINRGKAARNLSNTNIYILPDITAQRSYALHWLIHVRTEGNSFADSKRSNDNLTRHLPSLQEAGYVELFSEDRGFGHVWEAVLGACRALGTAPSNRTGGPNYLGRRFFVPRAELQMIAGLGHDEESLLAPTQQRDTAFQTRIDEAHEDNANKRRARLKAASPLPKRVLRVTESFTRNADVVAERLYLADGVCDKCRAPAPFMRAKNNTPFLEVHHILPLADDGEDTVDNTQALCPNCHRQAHFG